MSAKQSSLVPTTSPSWKSWLYACGYFLIITLICYGSALAPGQTFLPADIVLLIPPWSHHSHEILPGFHAVARPVWDPLFQFYPARKFLAESLHAGVIPWHNPHSFSGTPFVADGQSAVFYPINWLYAVLPLASAFGIVAALHTFLSGLFFSCFGRQRGYGWTASLAGGTAWMLCGTLVAWQMWQVIGSTLCWLPIGLYFVNRIVQPNRQQSTTGFDVAGLGTTIGLMVLAGHLQFAFYALMIMTAYGVTFAITNRQAFKIPVLVCAFAIGVLISAVQVLPTLGLLSFSLRTSYTIDDLLKSALPFSQLALLLMPEITGGQRDWMNHPYLGAVNYYETCCYFGASTLLFALIAITRLRTKYRTSILFWLSVALVGILLGCGTPLYNVFYYGIPLFKSFHGLSRALVLTEFAFAALSMIGVQTLDEIGYDAKIGLKKTIGAALGCALLLTLVAYSMVATHSTDSLNNILTHDWLTYGLGQVGKALASILIAGVIALFVPRKFLWSAVVVIAADMLVFATGINPGAPAISLYPDPVTSQLTSQIDQSGRVLCLGNPARDLDRMVPNSAMAIGLKDVSGSDPLLLRNYDQLIGDMNRASTGNRIPYGQGIVAVAADPKLNLLNVKSIISPIPLNLPQYKLKSNNDVFVYQNPNAKGEAWLEQLADDTSHLSPIKETIGNSSVDRIEYQGQKVVANVTSSVSNSLTFSEIADPAWKVLIDNHVANWTSKDGDFVTVPISPGAHQVVLSYSPDVGRVGMFVACLGWMVMVAIVAFSMRRQSA